MGEYTWRNSDAAKRMADTIALHQTALSKDELLAGRYVAIRLADGGSDQTAYDTRAEAIAHQINNPSRCGYFRVPLERWNAQTCDVLLWYVRGCYDSGFREDPAHQLVIPNAVESLR
jgi:hypothetical protein